MKLIAILAVALLAGCETTRTVWVKPGSSQQEFHMDAGQCRAQAFAIPGAPPFQIEMVYISCMHGKGWHQRQV